MGAGPHHALPKSAQIQGLLCEKDQLAGYAGSTAMQIGLVFEMIWDCGASILEVAPMGELCQLLKGFLEALDPLVLVEGLVRSTIDLVEEVRRRKEEHKH